MRRSLSVRTLGPGDIADCSHILYALPDWFGMEESNRTYVDSHHRSLRAVAPLFESLNLLGTENAALVFVKHLACGIDGGAQATQRRVT